MNTSKNAPFRVFNDLRATCNDCVMCKFRGHGIVTCNPLGMFHAVELAPYCRHFEPALEIIAPNSLPGEACF